MRKVIFIIAILLLNDASAQYKFQWYSIYHGNYPWNGSDNAMDIVGDQEGNVFITGISFGEGGSRDYRYDAVTIKYNSNGDSVWVQRFNHIAEDIGKKIRIDNNNNVYVAGESSQVNGMAILLLKYDSEGNSVWTKNFHDTINYYRNNLRDMILESNGDFYIGGYSYGRNPVNGSSSILLKFNSHGNLHWITDYKEINNYNRTYSIYKNSNGLYSTGSTSDTLLAYRNFLTIKYNLNGDILWVRKYDFGSDAEAYSILSVNDGSIYVVGYRKVNNTDYEMKLIKYNSTGEILWIKSIPARPRVSDVFPGYRPNMLNIDHTENIYVNFGIREEGIEKSALAKFNTEGNLIWLNKYEISQGDFKIDNNENLYVAGSVIGNFFNNDSYAILKYDTKGNLQTILRNYMQFDKVFYPSSLFIFANGDIASTGATYQQGFSTDDYFTIKYSYSVGITPTSSETPSSFSLSQNYPNPFNPTTNIRFQIPESGFVTLKVFDITGREVATLVNEQMNAGEFNYQFSSDNYQLGSGVYFYRLTVNGKNGEMNFSETKKMVVVR